MRICRITAKSCGPSPSTPKATFTLVCGTENNKIADGEWYGQVKQDGYTYPFTYKRGGREILYGWGEHHRESTNIGTRDIVVGEYFVVEEDNGHSNIVFQISHVHQYPPN
jgi:hypothetical protein